MVKLYKPRPFFDLQIISDNCCKIFWSKISAVQCTLEKEIELDWGLSSTQQQIYEQVKLKGTASDSYTEILTKRTNVKVKPQ